MELGTVLDSDGAGTAEPCRDVTRPECAEAKAGYVSDTSSGDGSL